MAYAIEVTLSTGNKLSLNYQSQEVGVSLTYRLEREDTDVLAVVAQKTAEVVAAHALAWQGIKAGKSEGVSKPKGKSKPAPETVLPDEETTSEESAPAATPAQLTALRCLLPPEWSEATLQGQLSFRYSTTQLEQLSARQVATWLLELQRTRRQNTTQRVRSHHP